MLRFWNYRYIRPEPKHITGDEGMSIKEVQDLKNLLKDSGYSPKAIVEILRWYE
jgi:hypothetical protein